MKLEIDKYKLLATSNKNIGRKVLNFKDITFNKRFGNLIGRNFEMLYVSYCHPLTASVKIGRNIFDKILTIKR